MAADTRPRAGEEVSSRRGVRQARSLLGRRAWVCAGAALAVSAGAGWLFGLEPALLALGSTILAWASVPPLVGYARRHRVVSHPGGRSVHRRVTPLLGGAAVFLPLVLAVGGMALDGDARAGGLLGALSLMVLVGIVDDVRGVRARTKLFAQAAGAGFLLLAGFRLQALDLEPFGTFALGWLEIPIVVLWVVSVTNAFNLVDGLDGLAGSLVLVAAVGGALGGASPILAAALAGGSIGFLRHNLPRARIFLGDTGSLLLGMSVAALTLDLPVQGNVAVALGLVSYAAGDVAISVVRRVLRAKPPLTADKSHCHHKILAASGSPVRTILVLFAFASLQVALALLLPGLFALVAMGAVWGGFLALLIRGCRVRVGPMFAHRRDFRRIHAVRKCVLTLVDVAREPTEVHRALQIMPQEFDLAAMDFFGSKTVRHPSREGRVRRVELRLPRGAAAWEYVPCEDDCALDDEVQTVVNEILRSAGGRLAALEAAEVDWRANRANGTPRRDPVPDGHPDGPETVLLHADSSLQATTSSLPAMSQPP